VHIHTHLCVYKTVVCSTSWIDYNCTESFGQETLKGVGICEN
jgi:hypothetical protein